MYEILKNRATFLLAGNDSLKFIQNISTNDIEKNIYSYNYLLNNQGRYLFDFFAYRKSASEIYLDCSADQKEQFFKRLSLYKLRSNLEITDVSHNYITIYTHTKLNISECLYFQQDPRYSKLGYRGLITNELSSKYSDSTDDFYMNDKYNYAIIDGYLDLISEKSIPIEFAGEEQNALSFSKGCYVGQEVIARAKHQGVIRKKIYKLDFGTKIALSLKLADVTNSKGDVIGKVCSNYQNVAIAWIREENLSNLTKKQVMVNEKLATLIKPEWS